MIKNILLFEFRNLAYSILSLAKGETKERVNFFFGQNASGKTSILEAIYILRYQKSFRAKNLEQCIRKGNVFFGLKFEINDKKILIDKHIDSALKSKLDNENTTKDELERSLPMLGLLSEHHENLVIGQVDTRRKFVDEIMFHMEPDYRELHKSYQKYLESRNHSLKVGRISDDGFYLNQLAELGEEITALRERYLNIYLENLKKRLSSSSITNIEFIFKKGYEGNLRQQFEENKQLDMMKKTTSLGPHKCDIAMLIDEEKSEYFLSRGQIKLLNMAMVLVKIDFLAKAGSSAVLLVDDYFAEMDNSCLMFLQNWLEMERDFELQIFINAVSVGEFERMNYLGFESYNLFEVSDGKILQID